MDVMIVPHPPNCAPIEIAIAMRFCPRLSAFVGLLFVFMLLPSQSRAECSKVLLVPAWTAGKTIIVKKDQVSGVFPTIVRAATDNLDCQVSFQSSPPARACDMFEKGVADMLVSMFKTPRRDEVGEFVPLIRARPTLITLDTKRDGIDTIKQLIESSHLRVTLVRGHDYGPAYQEMIAELKKQDRLSFEPDALSVARMMKLGHVQATVMVPTIFYGAIYDDERVEDLIDKLRFEPLKELTWRENGIYLSRKSLSEKDRVTLRNAFTELADTEVIWKIYQRTYPSSIIRNSIMPIENNNNDAGQPRLNRK